jgi:hypothetical protein
MTTKERRDLCKSLSIVLMATANHISFVRDSASPKDKGIALEKAYTSVGCALIVAERLLRDAWADDPEHCPIPKGATLTGPSQQRRAPK